MYESFYGLNAKPFQLTPDPRYFFSSTCHKKALAYLQYGVYRGEGFVVITGAPGTGKTTLMQTLVAKLPVRGVVVVELVTTHLEEDDVLRAFAGHLDLPYEGLTKAALLKSIEDFLTARALDNDYVLLIVDEAHHLSPRALDELRMLTNFQLKARALLQCVLLGQEPLRETLAMPQMEQLRQRVIAACHLRPLSSGETRAYIEHRLGLAGWHDDPHITREAYALIHDYTGGIVRRINVLCDRLLLFGCLEACHHIDDQDVMSVHKELAEEYGEADERAVHAHGQLANIARNEPHGAQRAPSKVPEVFPEVSLVSSAYAPAVGSRALAAPRAYLNAVPNTSWWRESAVVVESRNRAEPDDGAMLEDSFPVAREEVELAEAERTEALGLMKPEDDGRDATQENAGIDRTTQRPSASSRGLSRRRLLVGALFALTVTALISIVVMYNPFPSQIVSANLEISESLPLHEGGPVSTATDEEMQPKSLLPPNGAISEGDEVMNDVLDARLMLDVQVAQTGELRLVEGVAEADDVHSQPQRVDEQGAKVGVPSAAVDKVPVAVPASASRTTPVPASAPAPTLIAEPEVAVRVEGVGRSTPPVSAPVATAAPESPSSSSIAASSTPSAEKIASVNAVDEFSASQESGAAAASPPAVASTTSLHGQSTGGVTPIAAAPEPQTPVSTQPPPNKALSRQVPRAELDALLTRFKAAYEMGNVAELMNLFGATIRTNDSIDRKGVEKDYRKLFGVTDVRNIAFSDMQWSAHGDRARGQGQFNVVVRQKGRFRPDTYSGSIRIQVEKNAPRMLITEIFYDYN